MKFKYLFLAIAGIGLALIYFLISPSEVDFLPKCPFYSVTGLYCPGCGSQRATHQLLHFNLTGVLQQNLLYFMGMIIIAYHLTIVAINYLFKKNIYNLIYHPKTPIVILVVIIAFWITRNIPIYPFNILAPLLVDT